MSLRAVAKNGAPIAATNAISVAQGDTITVEILVFGWGTPAFDRLCVGGGHLGAPCVTNADCPGSTCGPGTGLVQTYQARLLGAASAISNGADFNNNAMLVLPVGWHAPVVEDLCPCENPSFPDCDPFYGCIKASRCVGGTNAGGVCTLNTQCPGGTCNGLGHTPLNMASINNARTDYIFFGFDAIRSVDSSTIDVRWGGVINGADAQTASRCQGGTNIGGSCTTNADCPGSTCNPNFLSYGGTLNLKVGAQGCGTSTFRLDNNSVNDMTFISNPQEPPIDALPILENLVITVAGVDCPNPIGACCNENTGVCANSVTQTSCTGRWGGAGSTCETISPACLVPTGACCVENTGVCSDGVAQASCTGRWGGIGSTCATLNPPCQIPTGACCVESTGACTNGVPLASCTGRWGGPDSTCATLSPPCANTITGVNPAHCLIDARIPNLPNQPAQRRGFTSMTLTFQNPAGAGEDAPADFAVTQIPALPAPPNPPTINSPVVVVGNTVTLNFSVPIQPNRWTCVRHIASNSRRCIGFLPADADGNGTAVPADILKIIDNLNGIVTPTLPSNLCDIDRSNACVPADIIAEIDLLNGAGYPNQNGRSLEACPSTTP